MNELFSSAGLASQVLFLASLHIYIIFVYSKCMFLETENRDEVLCEIFHFALYTIHVHNNLYMKKHGQA